MGVDPRFLASSGREIYTGNELLVKGALEVEGGVHLMTGYPGSPISGFFDTLSSLKDLLMKQGVRAFQSNNEALAVAAANGSQMAPCRTIVAFKNVGTHVASDALALANLAGAHPDGGAIIISGEDPWCDSTQVPADSRFLFEHLRMPVIEPGTAQQLKDWIGLSFKLSQVAGLYIGYIVTTANADGGGTVQVSPNHWPELNTKHQVALDTNSIPVDRTVLLPPRTWMRELEVPERFARTITAARVLGVNHIQQATPQTAARLTGRDGRQPIGFITTGLAKGYLEDVLSDLGLSRDFPILNFGMSYPIDVKLVSEFADTVRTMVVVEERRSFLERNIRDAVFQQLPQEQATDINSRLFGKKFPGDVDGIPSTRGLYVSVLAQHIIPLLRQTEDLPHEMRNGRLSAEMERIRKACKTKLNVIGNTLVARTPTFCPGCPHRDSSATLLEVRKNFADPEYMKRVHNRAPVDMVAHGDTGCYTMLMFQPTESLMHNYSGMGLGGGTGSGIDPFITNKQIVFMGDGTFFHSGQIAISNAVKASQDITFIILENGTTAMTGHQEHAGTEIDLLGNRSYIQDISEIVRGMAGTSPMTVVKLRPDDRSKYKETLEKTILADGVKVIIADKECGITANRTISKQERKIVKEHGYLPRKTHMNVTPEVCEHCLECTKQTACPGLTTIETDYGRKIDTDLTWCVNDGACERVRTSNDFGTSVKPCPSFEQVTVVRKRRRRYTLPHLGLDKLPDPVRVHDMEQAGASWRVHMAGVGGMGIGVVGAILSRAGHKEGYHVAFQDKKGLAIRNGGVFSQITFLRDEQDGTAPICTGNIPYGKADLLLGIDILEAARAIDPRQQFRIAATDRTAAVLNLYKQPTVGLLLGKDDFDIDVLRDEIFQSCKPELSFARNLSDLCERRLGTKQFANIMMLGVAYQLGLIPVSAHSIAWAIKDSIRRDQRKNIKAFDIGRKLALDGRALPNIPHPDTWAHLVTNKSKVLRKTRWGGRKLSQRYEQLVQGTMKQMRDLPEQGKYDIALRIYDLMQYDTDQLSRQYIEQVRQIYRRDSADRKFAATMAAIRGIAKVTLIKDEPYVAYLLTRYEKKQRDILKYNVDVSNGDRLVYRHHTSPEFNIGKHRIRLKITTTDWQLKIAAKCKWWRKLPGWHKREVTFRDWYNALPARLRLEDDAGYAQAVRILKCVDEVSGYREVRYPKMESVRRWVETELGGTATPSAQPATVAALV